MVFNSFKFIFLFFPSVMAISTFFHGRKLLIFLTLASFAFYAMAGQTWFLIPMLVTTTLDFFLAQKMSAADTKRKRNAYLMLSLTCNLGLLMVFKYGKLIFGTFAAFSNNAITTPDFIDNIILPAGISFYTFQSISYMIDVWRGECVAEKDFWLFAGFISFFPHLVAGPLTRHNQLIPQLRRLVSDGIQPEWTEGVTYFAMGLFKKVIMGDALARSINPMISLMNTSQIGFAGAWIAVLGFAAQIYFDFSGYSDMAVGVGLMMGVRLPKNFNSPLKCASPGDFWVRWHMTLGRFFQDYVYFPLGGSKSGGLRTAFNLTFTMVLAGLWHGANWTFACWGLYVGVMTALTRTWWSKKIPQVLQRPLGFFLTIWGHVLFRSPDFGTAKNWWLRMMDFNGVDPFWWNVYSNSLKLLAVAFVITQFFKNSDELAATFCEKFYRRAALAAAVVVAILYLNHSEKFIYFQF